MATIRPFNTYGPRQSARAVIPTIITQALREGPVHLGSLHPRRDLTFVEDTVSGFLAVAGCDACLGQVTNVGSGAEISIGDLARTILRVMGREDLPIVSEEARTRPAGSEVERLLCDNSLARERMGWRPQVPLEEGLRCTVDWIREHQDRYREGYQV